MSEPASARPDTVEALVRAQLSRSLGGQRGMLEAGVPSLAFTVIYLVGHDLKPALLVSAVLAVAALGARLMQRSSVQYVLNAVVGIAIGWVAVRAAAHSGGDEKDQAIAFFVPGIIITGIYTVVLIMSCVSGWPGLGFVVGSAAGDSLAWHGDPPVVRLCTKLTWLFLAPGGILVLLEAPIAVAGLRHWMDEDAAVSLLGVARLAIGWPLRALFWGLMVWVLGRGRTPLAGHEEI